MTRCSVALVFAVVAGLLSPIAFGRGDDPAAVARALEAAKVTLTEAIAAARTEVQDGQLIEAELERDDDDDDAVYEVSFLSGDWAVEVKIDAATGEVLGLERERLDDDERGEAARLSAALAKARTSPEQAIAAALARIPGGKAYEIEAEDEEEEEIVYEIEVLSEGKLFKVEVDGKTGEVGEVEEYEGGHESHARVIDFDDQDAGAPPAGWKIEGTNQRGPIATWQILQDANAASGRNILALVSPNHDSNGTFNLYWTDKIRFSDGVIEVKIRANAGRVDQGGGPIWRVKDKDNYMICRYNPLEENFRLYYVEDGNRRQLASAKIRPPILAGRWFTIRVEQKGDAIECYLDGKKLLEARDDNITGEGGVGVWTKADAATSFDDLTVEVGDDRPDGERRNDDDDDDDDGGGRE